MVYNGWSIHTIFNMPVSEETKELIHMLIWYPEMDTEKKLHWIHTIMSESFPKDVIDQARERFTRYYTAKSIASLQSIMGKEK